MSRQQRKEQGKEIGKADHAFAFYTTHDGQIKAFLQGNPAVAVEGIKRFATKHDDIFQVIETAYKAAKEEREKANEQEETN